MSTLRFKKGNAWNTLLTLENFQGLRVQFYDNTWFRFSATDNAGVLWILGFHTKEKRIYMQKHEPNKGYETVWEMR